MPVFSHYYLRDYLRDRLTENDVDASIAEIVADNLVESSLKGHDSHGVSMLPRYIEAIREGGLSPHAQVEKTLDFGSLVSFDGQQGFGQVVAKQALAEGITRAQTHGLAVVSLANAHHLGRIGAWAEQAAEVGLVSLHFANVYTKPVVLPWQGQQARFGTNPFCAGIPVEQGDPVILDFATSMIAGNKARIAWNEGKSVAPGCIVDNEGNPTVDPRWLMEQPLGALLPFGEHKGSGLSLICSLLGAALTGGKTERTAKGEGKQIINSMLSILIDPKKLGGATTYQQEIPALLEWVRQSRDDDGLLLPGDKEKQTYRQRLTDGIFVDDISWGQLSYLNNKVA
ncbi:malate/lactate/ureidoglycolate dehydrogenase [Pectobacterium parmentieri]|uniref:Malate/lactate/ureidoglycolate dehydrogenase n=1 Tax=Pectobacterium parmentieri TaxID=1905730 RepID=A0A8B3F7Q8_PECPM|nr:malate/lactate/ureidoglycolate dehydrogenase [Pectobacterium parmentieri]AOR59201.1 dehydrogenase [Pectobacterium parmentieri]AYH09781.1 malate/lactate/ureidoglycolate dehydrogenase [Pectobacterium parmentieri]AYH19509.1 malate/lactate/ureidoglycolate dehydrogenase [Pectobacterium parmentieri]AYH36100.1 malate/lactate/ureidoglycolate dehydrogenase [Pectobacterium parmentieri]AZS56205.1 malate/lactate/ureidoglycolate dehydrogenase [Pectobacterium parmentieri]